MDDIFSDLLDVHVIIYLDDILVYSDNPADHTKHVREVLCCLRKNGLFAHPDKCQLFSANTVKYLGFILQKMYSRWIPLKYRLFKIGLNPTR